MSFCKPTSAGRMRSARATTRARSQRQPRQPSTRVTEALECRALFSAITGFSLVNSDTDQVISPLAPGQVIDLAVIGTTHLNVAANTDGDRSEEHTSVL